MNSIGRKGTRNWERTGKTQEAEGTGRGGGGGGQIMRSNPGEKEACTGTWRRELG